MAEEKAPEMRWLKRGRGGRKLRKRHQNWSEGLSEINNRSYKTLLEIAEKAGVPEQLIEGPKKMYDGARGHWIDIMRNRSRAVYTLSELINDYLLRKRNYRI